MKRFSWLLLVACISLMACTAAAENTDNLLPYAWGTSLETVQQAGNYAVRSGGVSYSNVYTYSYPMLQSMEPKEIDSVPAMFLMTFTDDGLIAYSYWYDLPKTSCTAAEALEVFYAWEEAAASQTGADMTGNIEWRDESKAAQYQYNLSKALQNGAAQAVSSAGETEESRVECRLYDIGDYWECELEIESALLPDTLEWAENKYQQEQLAAMQTPALTAGDVFAQYGLSLPQTELELKLLMVDADTVGILVEALQADSGYAYEIYTTFPDVYKEMVECGLVEPLPEYSANQSGVAEADDQFAGMNIDELLMHFECAWPYSKERAEAIRAQYPAFSGHLFNYADSLGADSPPTFPYEYKEGDPLMVTDEGFYTSAGELYEAIGKKVPLMDLVPAPWGSTDSKVKRLLDVERTTREDDNCKYFKVKRANDMRTGAETEVTYQFSLDNKFEKIIYSHQGKSTGINLFDAYAKLATDQFGVLRFHRFARQDMPVSGFYLFTETDAEYVEITYADTQNAYTGEQTDVVTVVITAK